MHELRRALIKVSFSLKPTFLAMKADVLSLQISILNIVMLLDLMQQSSLERELQVICHVSRISMIETTETGSLLVAHFPL